MGYYYSFPTYHIIWISFIVLLAIIICIVRARRNARYASATQPQTVIIPIEPPTAMQPYPPIQHQQPYGYGVPAAGPPPPGSYPQYQQPYPQQPYPPQPTYPPQQTYPPQSPYQPQQQQPYPQMQPSPAVATASVCSPMPTPSVAPGPVPTPGQAHDVLFSPPPLYTPANPALQPAPPVETSAASTSVYPTVYGAQAGPYGLGLAEGQKAKEQDAFVEDKSQRHSQAPRGPQGQGSL
ncbi:hypothetical protein EC968_002132 [Mortierella alpina]|nr:hypothetical protein EC968_002132 [Mortierella alpina]